ncbi:unnamed protein product [Durusdinium trenchii]|uniref:Uncharacterized protein n=1 Tax=Durusdinium trenchii TaxID=1381693 RepID=A0ABP0HDB9_9DINO
MSGSARRTELCSGRSVRRAPRRLRRHCARPRRGWRWAVLQALRISERFLSGRSQPPRIGAMSEPSAPHGEDPVPRSMSRSISSRGSRGSRSAASISLTPEEQQLADDLQVANATLEREGERSSTSSSNETSEARDKLKEREHRESEMSESRMEYMRKQGELPDVKSAGSGKKCQGSGGASGQMSHSHPSSGTGSPSDICDSRGSGARVCSSSRLREIAPVEGTIGSYWTTDLPSSGSSSS